MKKNIYMQGRHILLVDGIPLSGFADGDYVQIKQDGNAASRTQGGDGPQMSISVAQGGQFTISLLPTSPVLGLMYELRNAQKLNPRLISIVLMSGVEEMITASGCAFGDQPQFATGGPTMQPRQFALECLAINMDLTATELIGATN